MASMALKPPSLVWGVVIGFVGLLGFCCDLDPVDDCCGWVAICCGLVVVGVLDCCGSPTWGVGGFQRGVAWGLVVVWVIENWRVWL